MAEPQLRCGDAACICHRIVGIYAGWRGTIAKMTGFYDLSGAFKTLLFGLVAGVLIAFFIDS